MNITKAQSAITAAFICGVISTFLTLCAAAIGMHQGGVEAYGIEMNALLLIDFGLMLGLTIGIYFKSRVCAVAMLVYFVISKVMQWSNAASAFSLLTGSAFIFFYFRGAWATIVHRRLKAKEANQALQPTPMLVTDRAGARSAPSTGVADL